MNGRSWSQIGMILWFALYGINFFIAVSFIGIVLAILAIFIAICLIFQK